MGVYCDYGDCQELKTYHVFEYIPIGDAMCGSPSTRHLDTCDKHRNWAKRALRLFSLRRSISHKRKENSNDTTIHGV